MNFWIQSFLGDVPEIKVGFRDDKGIVNKIESFQTLEVPKYAENWVSHSTKKEPRIIWTYSLNQYCYNNI
jgi:hypothetical protein